MFYSLDPSVGKVEKIHEIPTYLFFAFPCMTECVQLVHKIWGMNRV